MFKIIFAIALWQLIWLAPISIDADSNASLADRRQDPDRNKTHHFAAGEVTTLVDEIDAGAGGLEIDRDGNLYTADFGWHLSAGAPGVNKGGDKIFKVTPQGQVSIFCKQQNGASGNRFDDQGNLFQSSIRGGLISRISPQGQVAVYAKQGLRAPVGIAIDEHKNLYVCNCGSNSIQQISPDGKSKTFSQDPLFRCPNGIALGDDGNLFVCNFGNGDVIKVDAQGKASLLATLPGGNNGHLIYLDRTLIVVSRSGNRVYQVGLDGKVSVLAGTGRRGKQNGPAGQCEFSLPNSIVVSPDQKFLYVNETSPTSGDPRILGPTRIRRIELKRVNGPIPESEIIQQPNRELQNGLRTIQLAISQQNFKQAESRAMDLIKKFPQQAQLHFFLGYARHAQKDYSNARIAFTEAAKQSTLRATCFYNIACSYAIENDADQAIASLEKSIKAGFNNFDQLKNDSDFDNVRDDPRFQAIIKN